MNIAGALALTGTVALIASIVLAISTEETATWKMGRLYGRLGWGAFAVSMALFIAAVWVQALGGGE